jgi:hypothetical protein
VSKSSVSRGIENKAFKARLKNLRKKSCLSRNHISAAEAAKQSKGGIAGLKPCAAQKLGLKRHFPQGVSAAPAKSKSGGEIFGKV